MPTMRTGTVRFMICDSKIKWDGVHPAACGKCPQCRVNRQRRWATRIGLELAAHAASSMLTLTYSGEHLPAKPVRKHVSRFIRYLRRRLPPFRFFAAAELGDKNGRPHYHIVLFGVAATLESEEACRKAWSKGYVLLKEVRDIGAADYVCKYILKAQSTEQSSRDGQPASWSLMSRRPGIGRRTLESLAGKLDSQSITGDSSLGIGFDGPNWTKNTRITSENSVRLDGRLRPLDRYSKKLLFPEKEGLRVKRLKTLRNSRVRREGGSFSEVEHEAKRILEGRLAASRAVARLRKTTL